MSPRRADTPRKPVPFGTGQHGGELPDIEQGGRHGQHEKGDHARTPGPGGAGYPAEPRRGKSRKSRPRSRP